MSLGLTWEASGAGFFVPNLAGCHRRSRNGLISGENIGSILKSEEALVPSALVSSAGKPLAGTSAHGRTVSPKLGCSSISRGVDKEASDRWLREWTNKILPGKKHRKAISLPSCLKGAFLPSFSLPFLF